MSHKKNTFTILFLFIWTFSFTQNLVPNSGFDSITTCPTGRTLVSGQYTALGGEDHITIGNFKSNSNTDTTHFLTPLFLSLSRNSYYRVDDVSITVMTSINKLSTQNDVTIFPNPFIDKINIELEPSSEIYSLKIYDITGRIVLKKTITTQKTINTSRFQKGVYIYELRNSKEVVTSYRKIIKNE